MPNLEIPSSWQVHNTGYLNGLQGKVSKTGFTLIRRVLGNSDCDWTMGSMHTDQTKMIMQDHAL